MNDDTCKTCVHWDRQDIPSYWEAVEFYAGYCGKVDGFLMSPGGIDDTGSVLTGPDFGCIHHEAKA